MAIFESERLLIKEKESFSNDLKIRTSELNNVVQQLTKTNSQLTSEIETREEAERALRRAEVRYRALFNNAFAFVGLLEPDGKVIEVNQTALLFLGVDISVVRGKYFWDCSWWSHDPVEQQKCRDACCAAANGTTFKSESKHRSQAGEVVYVDFSIKPLFDDQGKVIYLVPEG